MVELLRRRAMLANNTVSIPEWDYVWNSSKGLLSSNGWTESKVGSGSSSVSIVSDYLKFQSTSSNYYNFQYPNTYTKGVVEAELYCTNNAMMRLNVCGNDVYSFGVRLQTSSNYKGLYLGTSTSGTKIMTASYNTKYKIRLVLNENIGQVYVDDVLLLDNIDTTAVPNCSNAFISGRGTGGTSRESRLYSLKMKFGRV